MKHKPPQWQRFDGWVFIGAVVGLGAAFGLFCIVYRLTQGNFAFIRNMPALAKDMKPGDIFSMTATALGGLTIGGVAIMQYRKHKWAEYQADHQTKLEQATKTGERLSKAIEHLGSKNKHIRISAIHELKRLADDSERDREAIGQILLRFIHNETKGKTFDEENPLPQDVETATYMLGYWAEEFEGLQAEGLNLDGIWLKGANLRYANLGGVSFEGANLAWAKFTDTDLKAAILNGAILRRANLSYASLVSARLNKANLSGANLGGADFCHAWLEEADLRQAYTKYTYFPEEEEDRIESDKYEHRLYGMKHDEGELKYKIRAKQVNKELRKEGLSKRDKFELFRIQRRKHIPAASFVRKAELEWLMVRIRVGLASVTPFLGRAIKLEAAIIEDKIINGDTAEFNHAILSEAKLQGANFSRAEFKSAMLRYAEIDEKTCFDGAIYDDDTSFPISALIDKSFLKRLIKAKE